MPKPNEPLSPETEQLSDILADIWRKIQRASLKRNDPFRTPVLATLNLRGWPSQRTLILREVKIPDHRILFHTDIRSEKIAELKENPRASLLFYHPRQQIQIRMDTLIQIHYQDELWEEQWQKTSPGSLKIYLTGKKPGIPLLPADWAGIIPAPEKRFEKAELETGKTNFAVLNNQVLGIDYLHLAPGGHLRASWSFDAGSEKGQWLVP